MKKIRIKKIRSNYYIFLADKNCKLKMIYNNLHYKSNYIIELKTNSEYVYNKHEITAILFILLLRVHTKYKPFCCTEITFKD